MGILPADPLRQIRHIFRWDLDKTYLKTEFDSVRDIVRTARLTAEERENIPGSAALIRAIRDCVNEEHRHLVYFISGSPQQLRTVLEKKFALDGFMPDGFVLKPTVRHLLRGRFRALRGQVAYKLGQLLQGRAEAPIGTHETLFGDDAESDAFIYSLYADVVAGRIRGDKLRAALTRSGAYKSQIEEIETHLEAVVHEDPVRRIVIHLDQRTPPISFLPYFPRVVPIYNHLQTAILMRLDGTLPVDAICYVGGELLGKYGFEEKRLYNLAEDILRRRRLHYSAEVLEALADELRSFDFPKGRRPKGKAYDRTRAVIDGIAERADHLRSRPLPDEEPAKEPMRNYDTLWQLDLERREAAKRAKKLAAKKRPPSTAGR